MKRYLILTICLLLPFLASSVENINIHNQLTRVVKMKDDSIKVKEYLSLIERYELDLSVDEILKLTDNAQKTAQKIGWRDGLGLCHYYKAWFYYFSNRRDLAIDNFLSAAEFSDELSIQVNSYGIIANIYAWDKDYDRALHYAKKGGDLTNDIHMDDKTKAEALVYLGDIYRACGNEKEERNHYLFAFDISHRDHTYDLSYDIIRMKIYINLSNEDLLKHPFTILDYSMRIRRVYENSSMLEKFKTFAFLIQVNTGYISSVNKGRIKQMQLDTEAGQRKVYISGLIVLSLLIMILIWQNHSRKRAIEELAKANEMKSRFFGILNHDLRRPVAGLISYLQLKTEAPDIINEKEAAKFEEKTISTAKDLLDNMEDLLFWCKDQMQSFKPEFKVVAVSKLFEDTKAFFKYDETVNISFENPHNLKIKTDENYAKTIMRNLTSNSIKVTAEVESPQIIWKCYEEGQYVVLSVFNNGEKISQDKINLLLNKNTSKEENIKEGLGLLIIKDLAETISCDMKLNTDKIRGTEFLLLFKKS